MVRVETPEGVMFDCHDTIVCVDGFKMSVQAGIGFVPRVDNMGNRCLVHCTPKVRGQGPFTTVEVGWPSEPEPLLDAYAGGLSDDPVFWYVPASVVLTVIVKHGGILSGQLPSLEFKRPLDWEGE